jgi:hypothetical protein
MPPGKEVGRYLITIPKTNCDKQWHDFHAKVHFLLVFSGKMQTSRNYKRPFRNEAGGSHLKGAT